jgi:hypothetical protein
VVLDFRKEHAQRAEQSGTGGTSRRLMSSRRASVDACTGPLPPKASI